MSANAGTKMNGPYVSEVRFGIVMYGGVSLAIYINGVANELYEMARATPRPASLESDVGTAGTREVYSWLSGLLGDPALLAACGRHLAAGRPLREFFAQQADWLARADRVRLVVDVVSGTSAGGINGIFLAKALANNEAFSLLKDLWVTEGDIGTLLNDEGSRKDDRSLPPIAKHPSSLLNSDRMFARLLKALTDMSKSRAAPMHDSACTDELDLYVTTTDIRGATIALRLFDKLVPERRHRQVFRFQYRAGEACNDFVDGNRSFLAYAARCTSSFPFAFEPMTLKAIERGGGTIGDRDAWRRLFVAARDAQSESDPLERAYGDGGYLDNKPFSQAIDALAQREAEVPVERKLIYIEPSPQHPEDDDQALRAAGRNNEVPNAVSNAMAALSEIPRYETIREDLESVLQRNRMIERVERIVSQGEFDLELGGETDPYVQVLARRGDQPKPWHEMTLSDLRQFYGDAFMPYRRLRVYMVTDKLADRLAWLWHVDPESDRVYALRALVRVWRDTKYSDEDDRRAGMPTLNGFLYRFDLRYRTRRLRLLIRRVDALYRLLLKREATRLNEPETELSLLHRTLLARLKRSGVDLTAPRLASFDIDTARQALVRLRKDFIRARDETRLAELEFSQLGGEAATARRNELRSVLMQTLDLLLDTGTVKPAPKPDPSAPGASRPATRLADLLPGDVLGQLEALSKLPSSTRTMQERVHERAALLYRSMGEHATTQLQAALESDLAAMGDLIQQLVNGTAKRAALDQVGRSLGEPDWEFFEDSAQDGSVRMLARVKVSDTGIAELDSVEGKLLRRLLGTYHLRFDSYDQMSLPLYYGSNVGEPSTVEVLRISPEDATSLIDERSDPRKRKKLAGTALANFGGFLDEKWRRNDIMWGRFDGAERLIHALMPQSENAVLRRELTRAAHLAIVSDELAPRERAEVTSLVMQALDKLSDETGDERVKVLLTQLDTNDPTRRKQVEQVLTLLFENDGLLAYVSTARDVDRRLDPRRTLDHAARAATVAGRVLEGISEGRDVQVLPRWLSRIGLAAQALVAVSIPGSLLAMLWRHWLTLLYGMELLVLGLGVLLASAPTRSAGLTALALTACAHVITLGLRDVMREKSALKNRALWAVAAFLLALAAIGGWALLHEPLKCLLTLAECRVPG